MKMSSNSSSFSQSPESLNGLNIGKKIYFEDVGIGIKQKSGGGLLSKKGGQTPRCQVEGCKQDLNDVKSYYLRHKVCAMHSKSLMVIVSGLKQRFCQQCSRFHQLSAFDQGKRSCRRRLAGHNKRRRKPPPVSLLSMPYTNLSSFILENNSRAGGFLMDFTTRAYEGVFGNYLEHPPPNFLQGSTKRAHYPGPFIPPLVLDSICALSLLSNQSCSSRSQPLSLVSNYLLNSNGARIVQPAIAHGGPVNQFSSTTWCFECHEASNGSLELDPVMGKDQFSQPANGQYCGELDLTHTRTYYDFSAQHVYWSL